MTNTVRHSCSISRIHRRAASTTLALAAELLPALVATQSRKRRLPAYCTRLRAGQTGTAPGRFGALSAKGNSTELQGPPRFLLYLRLPMLRSINTASL